MSSTQSIVRELVQTLLGEHDFKVGDRVKQKGAQYLTNTPGTVYKIVKAPDGDEIHVKHDDGQDLRHDPSWLRKLRK